MEIDKSTASADENIVVYPRSYNKRGEERLHSVQGVTLDGREVNVKLRIDEAMLGKESTPSIAEFSREDVKAKSPCLASPDNGPDKREGMLLFTGCEVDGENRKGIPNFTARWAYVLASHSEAQTPVFGLGRVVMLADSQSTKNLHEELAELERLKPEGWEAVAERKRLSLGDAMNFSYFGQLYQEQEEASFPIDERQSLVDFADKIFTGYTKGGVVGGLLIRLQDDQGAFVPGHSVEVFPRWKRQNTYQSASDVMKFFFKSFDQRSKGDQATTITAMPIMRYSCGPSFKNYYFQKDPESSLLKIKKRYLINNEPTVSRIAFTLSKREESGDRFMLKYYPLSNPLCSVATIGERAIAPDPDDFHSPGMVFEPLDHSLRPKVGLSVTPALLFPVWYQPEFIEPQILTTTAPAVSPVAAQYEEQEVEESPPQETKELVTGADEATDHVQPTLEVEQTQELSADAVAPIIEAPSQEAAEGSTEAIDGDGTDLSDLFSDVPEDELREAEQAAAQILAEVAAAPAINDDVDSEVAQDDVSAETISEPESSAAESTVQPATPAITSEIRDSSSGVSSPADDLRMIDVSTEGSDPHQVAKVDADEIGPEADAIAVSPLVEVPPLTPVNNAPEPKKRGLAAFLEKQGAL